MDDGPSASQTESTGPSSPTRRRVTQISTAQAEALVQRLSAYSPRPEYLLTPGPYPNTYDPHSRRVDFAFRTTERFPSAGSTAFDDIDVDRSCIESRPHSAFVATEQRFLMPKSATAHCSVYDALKGLDAVRPRSFSVQLPPHSSQLSERGGNALSSSSSPTNLGNSKKANSSVVSSEPAVDRSWLAAPGGRISKSGTRDVYDFLVRVTASPGPIYNPAQEAVRPNVFGVKFSTQPRLSSIVAATSACKNPEADDDGVCCSLDSFQKLSTWSRAPSVTFGKPPTPFVHPNRELAPPAPPTDFVSPVRVSSARRRLPRAHPPTAPTQEAPTTGMVLVSEEIHCTEGLQQEQDVLKGCEEVEEEEEPTDETLYGWSGGEVVDTGVMVEAPCQQAQPTAACRPTEASPQDTGTERQQQQPSESTHGSPSPKHQQSFNRSQSIEESRQLTRSRPPSAHEAPFRNVNTNKGVATNIRTQRLTPTTTASAAGSGTAEATRSNYQPRKIRWRGGVAASLRQQKQLQQHQRQSDSSTTAVRSADRGFAVVDGPHKHNKASLSQSLFAIGLRSSKFPLLLREDYFSPESREAVQRTVTQHYNSQEQYLRVQREGALEGKLWRSSS